MWKKRQADSIPSIVKSIKLWCAAEIQLHVSFFFLPLGLINIEKVKRKRTNSSVKQLWFLINDILCNLGNTRSLEENSGEICWQA